MCLNLILKFKEMCIFLSKKIDFNWFDYDLVFEEKRRENMNLVNVIFNIFKSIILYIIF